MPMTNRNSLGNIQGLTLPVYKILYVSLIGNMLFCLYHVACKTIIL